MPLISVDQLQGTRVLLAQMLSARLRHRRTSVEQDGLRRVAGDLLGGRVAEEVADEAPEGGAVRVALGKVEGPRPCARDTQWQ